MATGVVMWTLTRPSGGRVGCEARVKRGAQAPVQCYLSIAEICYPWFVWVTSGGAGKQLRKGHWSRWWWWLVVVGAGGGAVAGGGGAVAGDADWWWLHGWFGVRVRRRWAVSRARRWFRHRSSPSFLLSHDQPARMQLNCACEIGGARSIEICTTVPRFQVPGSRFTSLHHWCMDSLSPRDISKSSDTERSTLRSRR